MNATNADYNAFLKSKLFVAPTIGIDIDEGMIDDTLEPFQKALVKWQIRKGRSANFAQTGLGKTIMSGEVARLTNVATIIVAPLLVIPQSVKEYSNKLGMSVPYVIDQSQINTQVAITNYERIDKFNPDKFDMIILDESSILRSIDGKTRQTLESMFSKTVYRHCFSATPAPNDIVEIVNHAAFLGIGKREEVLATFFVHDDTGWRLKGHAEKAFYRWLASWSMSVRKPSDLGDFDDTNYQLPPLNAHPVWVTTSYVPEGQLFFTGLKGITDRTQVRAATIKDRCAEVARLVKSNQEQWIIWHALNEEGYELQRLLKDEDTVLVEGSQSPEQKTASIVDFQEGRKRILIIKPKMARFGLNLQNSWNMAFCGFGDSWEEYYQCKKRQHRRGQTHEVNVYVVLCDIEDAIYHNVQNKEKEAETMIQNLIQNVQEFERAEIGMADDDKEEYFEDVAAGDKWEVMLGDSVKRMAEIVSESVDLTVTSPPFAKLYTYSKTSRDLGNSRDEDEFFAHFRYIIRELWRVTKAGRIAAIHVSDIPAMQVRDGYIGLKDFSGDVIRAFTADGWIFDARVPISKNQQAQSIRTHAKGLTMTQMEKDRTWSRPALPDYILKFRKPGENRVPVNGGEITRNLWIEFAATTWPGDNDRCQDAGAFPTWTDIRETDTLQGYQRAREQADERHICPLQLGTIERCVWLWTNRGEVVFDPFAGIGSTGVVAIRNGRKFLGCELKPSYWREAKRHLKNAEEASKPVDMFSMAGIEV